MTDTPRLNTLPPEDRPSAEQLQKAFWLAMTFAARVDSAATGPHFLFNVMFCAQMATVAIPVNATPEEIETAYIETRDRFEKGMAAA